MGCCSSRANILLPLARSSISMVLLHMCEVFVAAKGYEQRTMVGLLEDSLVNDSKVSRQHGAQNALLTMEATKKT